MKITEYLKSNFLILDGGMGTLLQAEGLAAGELPERWNLTRPRTITDIHRAYYDAGANVVNTNTFGASSLKFSSEELSEIVRAAIENARLAAEESTAGGTKWVALDIGPTGKLLKPYGDLDFEDAVRIFGEVVSLGERYGADLVFIETMNDSYETKAAVLAAKEYSSLPVFVSNAYGEDGKLMTGADPVAMIAMLEGLEVDAIGVNCSLGPKMLAPIVEKYLEYSSLPVIVEPNAGLPRLADGKTVFDVEPEEFAEDLSHLAALGARALGGCCGTTPEHIRELVSRLADMEPKDIEYKEHTLVSSYTHAVEIGKRPVLIGERINPTGKSRFKEALRTGNINYILGEGISEDELGSDILDVNVGLPEINEREVLTRVVRELQAIIARPLQIDTSDPSAMEAALRIYNGKPMINSVNGKAESLSAVLPLAKKYGGVLVALTLDEQGIPDKAEGRLAIARKILSEAERYGIAKKNIIFDPLALTVSADSRAAVETLRAVRMITEELGVGTSLGVSNVSFGLPARDIINGSFFTLALGAGLKAAIMNPHSEEMMKAYKAYLALSGMDDGFSGYIGFAEKIEEKNRAALAAIQSDGGGKTDKADGVPTPNNSEKLNTGTHTELGRAIIKGLCDPAAAITRELLSQKDPLAIISEDIVPALDAVGEGFEKRTVYLPALLMSAEAAGAAFEVIRGAAKDASRDKGIIVIATVKGDIHDIGKNIVKLLLENYGYDVRDLGRDVPPERIASETVRLGAKLVGLSALMTTTVPAMEETIKLLRAEAPFAKVMVGGAVLTPEYAEMIGADAYAKDAMEAVRCAERLLSVK